MRSLSVGIVGMFVLGACAIEVPDPDHFGSLPAAQDEAEAGASESGAAIDPDDDDDDKVDGDGNDDATTGDADEDDAGAIETDSGAPPPGDGPADPSDSDGAGESSGGEDGKPVEPGAQPLEGPWSSCLFGSECGAGMGCVTDGNEGFCSIACAGPNDPSGCPASPGGSAELGCIVTAGTSVCVLDCSGGKSCPSGMTCVQETADTGVIEICM